MRSAGAGLPREPWLAANLSAMIPGLGQLYAGRRLAAGLLFLGWSACAAAALWLLLTPEGSVAAGLAMLAAALFVFLANVVEAHAGARRANPPAFEAERRREKDPWLAVLLTVILPGLGHAYLRRWLVAGLLDRTESEEER